MNEKKVCLLYEPIDKDKVDETIHLLMNNTIKINIKNSEILPNEYLADKLDYAVSIGCTICLVFISKNSSSSFWIEYELGWALDKVIIESNIKIIPIMLNDVKLPDYLKDKDIFKSLHLDTSATLEQLLEKIDDIEKFSFTYNKTKEKYIEHYAKQYNRQQAVLKIYLAISFLAFCFFVYNNINYKFLTSNALVVLGIMLLLISNDLILKKIISGKTELAQFLQLKRSIIKLNKSDKKLIQKNMDKKEANIFIYSYFAAIYSFIAATVFFISFISIFLFG